MKSKKGQVAIVVVLVIGLILAIVVWSESHPYEQLIKMGARHNAILSGYTEAEAAREYISSAAENSIHQVLYSQGSLGSFQEQGCEDKTFLDCHLEIESASLKDFKCYEDSGKNDALCEVYEINYDLCTQGCNRRADHRVLCGFIDQALVCQCSRGDVTLDCDTLSEGDLENWEQVGCYVELDSLTAMCTVHKGSEEVATLICNEDNNFCDDYGINLNECTSESCAFKSSLGIVCEQKTSDKVCLKSRCGTTPDGYAIWYDRTMGACYPSQDEAVAHFISGFEDNFEHYLSSYNLSEDRTLYSSVAYDFETEKTATGFNLIGKPKKEQILFFNVDTMQIETKEIQSKLTIENEKYNFKYSVEPCFKIPVDYPLYNYDMIFGNITECVAQESCFSLNGKELAGFEWQVTADEVSNTLFDLTPLSLKEQEFWICGMGRLTEEPITLRFAVKELQVEPA